MSAVWYSVFVGVVTFFIGIWMRQCIQNAERDMDKIDDWLSYQITETVQIIDEELNKIGYGWHVAAYAVGLDPKEYYSNTIRGIWNGQIARKYHSPSEVRGIDQSGGHILRGKTF